MQTEVARRPYGVLDQLFDQAFQRMFAPLSQDGGRAGHQMLPLNMWETDEAIHASILAPGLDEQSLNVSVEQETLTIEGELSFQLPEGARIVWQEFGPARFSRSIRLGQTVDPARVEASYHNGVLEVLLPKAEHAKPRRVQVQIGGAKAQSLPTGKGAKA